MALNSDRPMSIASVVIIAVVVITLLGALAATFLSAANTISTEVGNASIWTNATIKAVVPALGLLVGIGLLLGFVALALNALDRST